MPIFNPKQTFVLVLYLYKNMKDRPEDIFDNVGHDSSEKSNKRALLGQRIGIAYLILFFSVGAASGYALPGDSQFQFSIKITLLSLCTVVVSYLIFKAIGIAKRKSNGQND